MKRNKQSPEAEKQTATAAILESISDGVFTVDAQWLVTSFNRAAEKITGVSRREAVGRPCAEVFRSSLCGAECALQKTLKTGRPVIGKSAYIVNAEGERIPIIACEKNGADTPCVCGHESVWECDLSDGMGAMRPLSAEHVTGTAERHDAAANATYV